LTEAEITKIKLRRLIGNKKKRAILVQHIHSDRKSNEEKSVKQQKDKEEPQHEIMGPPTSTPSQVKKLGKQSV